MAINTLKIRGSWREVADAARTTVSMKPGKKDPSSRWKKNMLLAEHSPIRQLMVKWKWSIKSWISVHFVRHKIGIEHYVSTQRDDRVASTGTDERRDSRRDDKSQSAIVTHECIANAQSIINISRKRLCQQAHKETRDTWKEFLNELKEIEPELVSVCVAECVYRGFCPELRGCGFDETKAFEHLVKTYRET